MSNGDSLSLSRGRAAYAVPGIVSWTLVTIAFIGVALFPRQWMTVSVVFLGYFILRMAVILLFAIVGEARRHSWERRDWTAESSVPGVDRMAASDVRHVVVIPNFKEPVALLQRTLDALAVQHGATERLMVVLGMEEREEASRAKGESLANEYAGRFAQVLVTVHPSDLPGEVAGKASNEAWAASQARESLEDLGWELENTTVTSCDADSRLHPAYLAAMSRLFAEHPKRHASIWQAPMFYYNNMWKVPAPIRFTAWFGQAGQLAELAMPFYAPLPISTYTLSMRLAEDVGWWDTDIISEDWHMYLQCHFERRGDMRLEPVYLPTSADCTDGDTWAQAMRNRFLQVTRHAWGAEDVGYMIRQMRSRSDRSFRSIARCGQVLHDHVARVITWFFVIGAYLLAIGAHPVYGGLTDGLAGELPGVQILGWLFGVGGFLLVGTIGIELLRNPPPPEVPLPKVAVELALMWVLLPVTGLYLGTLPAISAQTRLMLGRQMGYTVTPKQAEVLESA